jgi:ADP-heptose:LPS heptosyltransferase
VRTRLISLLTLLLQRWLRRRPVPALPSAPQRILILKPCCLGDVLLTTPLVATIRASYPAAEITYAVGPWARPMVADSPAVDQILTLPERWSPGVFSAVVDALRRRRFEIVFVPDRSPVLTLLVWLAQIPVRVGLDSAGRGFAYTHPAPAGRGVIHEAALYSSLAAAAGLPQPPERLFFVPTQAGRAAAEQLIGARSGEGPLVVLHPGGGKNPGIELPRKRWLPERWAAVADALAAAGAEIWIVGGPGDEDAVAALQAAMLGGATAHVRRWPWDTLGALLERAELFLGHDTGMMHLATAVGTPTLAVFGPSDPQSYGPYGAHTRTLWRPTAESPCFWMGEALPECPCAMQCMRNVAVADVLAAARELLALDESQGDP